MNEELDNKQVEMKNDNRLTKTEWEKIEIKGQTLDDLKTKIIRGSLLSALMVGIDASLLTYFAANGETQIFNETLLITLPIIGWGVAPYLNNIKEYFRLKKDYEGAIEKYEPEMSEEDQGMKL